MGSQASYAPAIDRVRLPVPERFESREDYYSTAYHELTHSTGIKGRCDRGLTENPPPFGTPDYSREELVAEMGAAFLCATAGIGPQTIAASASYIDGWRKKLRGDSRLVVQAAGQAQRAADFILGTSWQEAASDEAEGPDGDRAGDAPSPAPAEPPQEAAGGPQGDPDAADDAEAHPDPQTASRADSDAVAATPEGDCPAWDFETRFPAPLPQAVAAGVVAAEDAAGENLAALTRAHLDDCRLALAEKRRQLDAAAKGVDPDTGRKPRTAATRHKLMDRTAERATAAHRRYENLIFSYADAFGTEAAAAFQAKAEGATPPELKPATPPESAEAMKPEAAGDAPAAPRTSGPQLALFG